MDAIEHQKAAQDLWTKAGVKRSSGGDWLVRAARKAAQERGDAETLALLDEADAHQRAAQALRTKAAAGY